MGIQDSNRDQDNKKGSEGGEGRWGWERDHDPYMSRVSIILNFGGGEGRRVG